MRYLTASISPVTKLASLFLSLSFPFNTANADWQKVTGGLPADLAAEDIQASPDGTLFLSGQAGSGPVFYRSSNGGVNWSLKDSGILNSAGVQPGFFRIGAYDDLLLTGTNGAGIFRSTNQGESWQAAANLTNGSAFYEFAKVNEDTYLATKRENVVGESGIWVTYDRGANWTRRSNGLQPIAFVPNFGGIIPTEDVIVHNGAWFAAVNGVGIFRSTNEGLLWSPVNSGITVPGNVPETTFLASTPGRLWASAGSMLWMSTNNGDSWVKTAGSFGYNIGGLASSGSTLYAFAHRPDGTRRVLATTDGSNFTYTAFAGLTSGGNYDPLTFSEGKLFLATGEGLFTLNLSSTPLLAIPPVITSISGGGTFFTGATATLGVAAEGTLPLSYQWKKGNDVIANSNSSTLSVGPLTGADAGTYSVTVTNAGGFVTSQTRTLQVSSDLPGRFDPSFTAVGFNSSVSSNNRDFNNTERIRLILMQPDGEFWVGGHFRRGFAASVGTNDDITLKRANSDGTLDGVTNPTHGVSGTYGGFLEPDGGIVAPQFHGNIFRYNSARALIGTGPLASVRINTGNAKLLKLERLPDGRFFAAGSFNKATPNGGSVAADYNNIVLFNANGSIDSSFNANGVFGSSTLSYSIRSLAYDPEIGKLYVAGDFQNLTGFINAPKVIRLNMDGTHDPSFATHTSMFFNGEIETIALQPDGKVLIGTRFSGTNQPRNLERLLRDGSLDPTFNPGGAGPGGPNRRVMSIALNPDGGIIVGGEFSDYNGKDGSLVLLDANGVPDASFNAGGQGPRTGTFGTSPAVVSALAVSPDNQWIYLGMGGYRYHTSDGLTEFSFTTSGFPQYADSNIIRVRNKLSDLAIVKHPAEKIINEGASVTFDVKAFSTSALSYQWLKNGAPIPGATAATYTIPSAQLASEGDFSVIVSSGAGSITSTPARLLTLAQPRFLNHPPSTAVNVGSSIVISPEVIGQGEITYQWYRNGEIIPGATSRTYTLPNSSADAGGSYYVIATNTLGSTTSNVATVTMNIVGGIAESSFTANIPQTNTLSNINAVIPLADGSSIVGGNFLNAGNVNGNRYLVRLLANGSVDTSWPGHAKPNGQVRTIFRQADGKLLIAGDFTSFNGNTALKNIVRLKTDGSIDETFTPASHNAGTFFSAAAQSTGRIIIVGNFSTFGGSRQGPASPRSHPPAHSMPPSPSAVRVPMPHPSISPSRTMTESSSVEISPS